ncbi:MAG: hypothetical protein HW421_3178 [Ignavibacteria bacterium]|nr:hypothetical protein [Ignavibacteria bacterium]
MRTLILFISFFLLNSFLLAQPVEMNPSEPFNKPEQFLSKIQNKAEGGKLQGTEFLVDKVVVYNTKNKDKFDLYTYNYDSIGKMISELNKIWGNILWLDNRYTYTYDKNGNMLSKLFESGYEGKWENNYRNTYTYDEKGNKLSELFENGHFGQWENDSRYSFTYDENGNNITYIREVWENGKWVYDWRFTWIYDLSNKYILDILEEWKNDVWAISKRKTFNYDKFGNLILELHENWQNGKWTNDRRFSWTFDENKNQTSRLSEFWQNNKWENSSRYKCNYDSNNKILSMFIEKYETDTWINYLQYNYKYNLEGLLVSEITENWYFGQWKDSTQKIYSYDENSNLQTISNISNDNNNWFIADGWLSFEDYQNYSFDYFAYKIEVKYKQTSTVEETHDATVPNLSLNPNPANDFLNISYSIPEPAAVSFSITNSLGNELAKFNGNGDNQVSYNIENLPSGIYFLRMNVGSLYKTAKFVVMR